MDEVKDNAVSAPVATKKVRKSRQYYLHRQAEDGSYLGTVTGPYASLMAARHDATLHPEFKYMISVKCEAFEVRPVTLNKFKRI